MAKANELLTEELYEMTIGEILITDLETGIEMYSASLKSSNVNKTASTTKIRAGRDNVQWMELVSESEISVEVTDIQAKRDWMALKLGGQLTSQEIDVEAFPKNYKVTGAGKTITLDHEPKAGEVVVVYNKKTNKAIASSEAERDGVTITITASDVNENDIVYVGSYKYTTTAEMVSIPTSNIGRDVAITITRPVANKAQKVVYEKVYRFHRATLGLDFSDEATAEKGEKTVSTTFTVLKHSDYEDLGYLAYLPVE